MRKESPAPESRWLLAAAIPFVALGVWRLDYFPMWDGLQYYNCVAESARQSLNPWNFNCFRHPTMAYLWPVAIVQRLGGSYAGVILLNAALGCVAAALFARLCGRVTGRDGSQWLERFLTVALFACCPVIVANAVQLAPDFAVLVTFLGVAAALAEDRVWAAAAWGLAAMWCKEMGTPLYCVAVAADAAAFFLTGSQPRTEKLLWLRRRLPLLVVPVAAVVLVAVVYVRFGAGGFWSGPVRFGTDGRLPGRPAFDSTLRAMLTGMFVLNFQWIPTGGIVLLFVVSSVRRLVRRKTQAVSDAATDRFTLFLALLLAGAVIVLTSPRTFVNVRYHLPIYPLVLLLFLRALASAVSARALRIGVLGGTLAAFALATVRSADPVSASAYQVFPFGSHRMYSMTLISQECCGLGRDQLVYNLEFTELHYLLNQVLADVLRNPSSVLAMHPLGNWHLLEAVDRASRARALPSARTFDPTVITFDSVLTMARRPDRVFYIELPAMDDPPELDRWATLYRVPAPRIYSRGGFKLRVRELVLMPATRP